jgi:hypothetical protein
LSTSTNGSLTGADQDATAPTNGAVLVFNNGSLTSIRGIGSPSSTNRIIYLQNNQAITLTLRHEAAGATAANRIVTPDQKDFSIPAGGQIHLIYSVAQSRWIIQGGTRLGSITNDSAATGFVGESKIQSRLASAATSLTTATTADVLSSPLSLTAGDWDLSGSVGFNFGTATSYTQLIFGISLTSVTLPAADTQGVPTNGEVRRDINTTAMALTSVANVYTLPITRVSLSATTNFYLVARATFTVSTLGAFGSITARRVR